MDEKALLEAIGKMIKPIETSLAVIEKEVKENRHSIIDLQISNQISSREQAVVEQKLTRIDEKLEQMNSSIESVKEDAEVTRHGTNLLLKWAEKADNTAINVGLYGDE